MPLDAFPGIERSTYVPRGPNQNKQCKNCRRWYGKAKIKMEGKKKIVCCPFCGKKV